MKSSSTRFKASTEDYFAPALGVGMYAPAVTSGLRGIAALNNAQLDRDYKGRVMQTRAMWSRYGYMRPRETSYVLFVSGKKEAHETMLLTPEDVMEHFKANEAGLFVYEKPFVHDFCNVRQSYAPKKRDSLPLQGDYLERVLKAAAIVHDRFAKETFVLR